MGITELKRWWNTRKPDVTKVPDAQFSAMTDKPDDLRLMYTAYGEWARHYHNLVWAAMILGSSLATAGMVLFRDVSKPAYTAVGLGVLIIIYLSHQLAEGNRIQWAVSREMQNRIEGVWGVRDITSNPSRPLVRPSNPSSCWRVQFSRQVLSLALASITIVAVVAKWMGLFEAAHRSGGVGV